MKMLAIGIPSKGVSNSLLRVLRIALSFSFVEEIHVGINPGVNDLAIPSPLISDPRVKIVYHRTDLGLYGNFRFLASEATSQYFMWLCTDDIPTPQIETLLQVANSEKVNLVIPTWVHSEYFPNLQEHAPEHTRGRMPSLNSDKLRVKSAIDVDPSWMFGVWDRRYLVSIFPKRSFDWLDVHIMQKVLISNSVRLINVPQPAIIGTWIWANRIPNSVNPRGFSPNLAILYQIVTGLSLISLWPPGLLAILRRILNIYRAAKMMNSRINGAEK